MSASASGSISTTGIRIVATVTANDGGFLTSLRSAAASAPARGLWRLDGDPAGRDDAEQRSGDDDARDGDEDAERQRDAELRVHVADRHRRPGA